MIFSDFGGPGALFGEPGVHCEDFFWDCCDFWGAPVRKRIPIFSQNLTLFLLFAMFFLMFFRVLAFSIFCDFKCPEVPFVH